MNKKKKIRKAFRDAIFKRAGYCCQGPGCTFASSINSVEKDLDAHHITDRTMFANGGYVASNGIALCLECHKKAEQFHSTGVAYPGFSPEELYVIIDSSLVIAARDDSLNG